MEDPKQLYHILKKTNLCRILFFTKYKCYKMTKNTLFNFFKYEKNLILLKLFIFIQALKKLYFVAIG